MFNTLSAPLRLFIYSSSFTAAMDALSAGALLTAYAAALGAGPFVVGCIVATPYVGNAFQLLGTYSVFKRQGAKNTTFFYSLISRFFYLGCASLVLLPTLPHRPLWLLLFVAACYLTGGIAAGGYYPWLQASLPVQETSTFMRYKYTYSKIAYLGSFVLVCFWFKRYTIFSFAVPPFAYVGLFVAAFVCGILASSFFVYIPEVRIVHRGKPFYKSFLFLAKQSNFRRVIYIATLCCAISFCFFSLLPLFVLKQWNISVLSLTILTLLMQAAAIGSVFWWEKINKLRHTLFSAQCGLGGAVLLMGYFLFHSAQGPSFWVSTALFMFAGVMQVGISFAVDTLILLQAPQENQSPYFAWISLVKTLAATAIIVAGFFLSQLQQLFPAPLAWQLLFSMMIVGTLVCLYTIGKTLDKLTPLPLSVPR